MLTSNQRIKWHPMAIRCVAVCAPVGPAWIAMITLTSVSLSGSSVLIIFCSISIIGAYLEQLKFTCFLIYLASNRRVPDSLVAGWSVGQSSLQFIHKVLSLAISSTASLPMIIIGAMHTNKSHLMHSETHLPTIIIILYSLNVKQAN